MNCDICESLSCVRGVPVFQALSDGELSVIQSIIESNYYNKGQQVFREGEESDALFVVKSGLIKLTQCNAEGKQHVVRYLFPGDYFGQFALLHHKQNNFTAEIVESGSVCQMRRKDFLPLLEQNASLAFSFLMSMSEQLQQAEETAGVMHMFEVEKRLARLLVKLASGNKSGEVNTAQRQVIELPSAKKEIAAMIGTSAETLSRKLRKLISVNIITLRNRKVEILDMDSLLRIGGYK
ncbi:hypothetical protein A3844_19770 [Paenibacillus helianthi]|uniref:Crp/Fnr family transcriptional regulator n=1 Tax=Paenibacillus helianthi TaxID=1349432 RepID=A0ABX3ENI8_9BACL|nr:Crp/Fnr family transcriptional regulator [Paenibacillus helianthi]OKP84292.1 hypothetical protein A3844_19770 [Paenibacillus helianthi]